MTDCQHILQVFNTFLNIQHSALLPGAWDLSLYSLLTVRMVCLPNLLWNYYTSGSTHGQGCSMQGKTAHLYRIRSCAWSMDNRAGLTGVMSKPYSCRFLTQTPLPHSLCTFSKLISVILLAWRIDAPASSVPRSDASHFGHMLVHIPVA